MDYILINTMTKSMLMYLGISDDEANIIQGQLKISMINSLQTAQNLLGLKLTNGMISDEDYEDIFSVVLSYMVARATIDLYADTLAPGIMAYQSDRLSELEERLRYTKDPKGDTDNATES